MEIIKVPVPVPSKSTDHSDGNEVTVQRRKRVRTVNDFLLFCELILDHENYEVAQQEDQHQVVTSDVGSIKSIEDSDKHEETVSDSSPEEKSSDSETDDDSYDLVTCYCSKPFAGRPMIECSKCSTWIHLSCAKVKKNNIPEVFTCAKCKHHRVTRIFNLRHKKRYRYTV